MTIKVGEGLDAWVKAHAKANGCTEEEACKMVLMLPVIIDAQVEGQWVSNAPSPRPRKPLSLAAIAWRWWVSEPRL